MKKVIITLNEETSRFEAKDIDGKVYYTAARKSDVLTSIKRSKKYQLEIVEEFEVETKEESEASENAVNADPHAQADGPTGTIIDDIKPKKSNKYEDYKSWIITNANESDLKATGEFVAKFWEDFDLKLSSKKRSLTFEKVLEQMEDEKLIERIKSNGKYKKLQWIWSEDHIAAMSPDEEL